MSALRVKFLGGEIAQLRAVAPEKSGGPTRIAGYASVFNVVDLQGDVVQPGAFTRTLASRDWPVQMRSNHFAGAVGKWTALKEDSRGLYVEGELTPGHSVANDLAASIQHGATAGLSIGFTVPDGGASIRSGGGGFNLSDLDLFEVSITDLPANTAAEITDVRGFREETFRRDIEVAATLADVERAICRSFGISRRDARDVSGRFKELLGRELEGLRQEIAGTRLSGDVLGELRAIEAAVNGSGRL
jgi:uncharacterized protein